MVSDVIKFLHAHFSNVMLVLIIIIALLSFLLLMRRFRVEQHAARRGNVDTGASEGTLKALLQEIQSMPSSGAAPAKPVKLEQLTEKDRVRLEREVQQRMAAAGDPKSDEGAEILQQLRDKDTEIQRIQAKVKELQTRLENASAESSGGSNNLAEIESLQSKIQDLEARLKEYEIIEDDIADLSTYKEENARLRELLEEKGETPPQVAKNKEAGAEESPGAVDADSAPAESPAEELEEAQKAAVAGEGVESAEANDMVSEDVGEEPAADEEAAVQVDADQLLSEVDELLTLGEKESDGSSALDDDLNTDKLLAEAKDMPGDQAGE